ncbi:hypothetical protein TRFO_08150 [Tritrichomonas foetus]|uniref:Leucine Rich Repeat family protein n=1 Tax=Tritrichomonas foetus TaxID=1144522 RepID=A0A1J4JRI3_9EUKA|nr:hypothetical protein TRFO_08150 [Tritrichomonas foetus]|eukprot:OHS99860.1 hypothetical protein TRFO_08150 [Tritrichomonas foetus]
MELSEEAKIKNMVTSLGYQSLLISEVRKADSAFKSKFYISINDRNLMSFNLKGSKITNTFSWLKLSNIKREGSKFQFRFHKTKYAFEFSDENVVKMISAALQRILLHHELKENGWTKLNLPSISYSPISALNRIVERSYLLKLPINQSTMKALESILIYSQPSFSLNNIPHISTIAPLFFEALPMFEQVDDISFPKMKDFEPFSDLIPYVRYINKLRRFEIDGPKTSSFKEFIEKFNGLRHYLFSISFRRTELEEEQLNLVRDFLIGRMVKSIEFHDAIKSSAYPAFYNSFLNDDLLDGLVVLNLDGSKGIDTNFLLPKIKNITSLSLANCGVEVSDTLKKLSNFHNLKSIDLSYNPCRNKISSLPPNITSLYLNSVNWCVQTLSIFMSHLPNHYLNLWISNITTNDAEWQNLFTFLLHSKYFPLRSLTFDGNRIHPNLFVYLKENKGIDSLSICNCLSESNKECINALCYFIEKSQLRKLYVRGSKSKFIGRSIEAVIRATLKSSKLEYLDLTYNKSGDYGISQLRQLLSNKNHIRKLIIDGTKAETASLFTDFVRDARSTPHMKLSYPHNDISHLLKRHIITEEAEEKLKSLFRENPYEPIYRQYHSNDFPLYLRSYELENLLKPIHIVKSPTKPKETSVKPVIYNRTRSNNNLVNHQVNITPPQQLKQKIQKNNPISQSTKQLNVANNKPLSKAPSKSNFVYESSSSSPPVYSDENDYDYYSDGRKDYDDYDDYNNSGYNDYNYDSYSSDGNIRVAPLRTNSMRRVPQQLIPKRPNSKPNNNNNNNINNNQKTNGRNGNNQKLKKTVSAKKLSNNENKGNGNITTIKRPQRSASAMQVRKPDPKPIQKTPIQIDDDDYSENSYNYSDSELYNEKISAPKAPKTARKRVVKKKIVRKGPINGRKMPVIRGKKTEPRIINNVVPIYDAPNWDFPIKMNFVYEDERTKKIEKKYSTLMMTDEIMKKPISK